MVVVVVPREKAKELKKVNCYECKYCGDIPGSAHKKCLYALKLLSEDNDPMASLLSLFGGVLRNVEGMKVMVDETGVRGGWCGFPYNFDPIWIIDCDKFEKVGSENGKE